MKISIITVSYNSAASIGKTFISVKGQTFSNIEYIVVDGNSTDGTIELIKKNQGLITRWISEPDLGLYDAMNKGIKMATGDIVGILNSDDTFYNKEVLEKVAEFHKINEIDASVGDIIQHKENGKSYSIPKHMLDKAPEEFIKNRIDLNVINDAPLDTNQIKILKKYKIELKKRTLVVEVKKKNRTTAIVEILSGNDGMIGQKWKIPLSNLKENN